MSSHQQGGNGAQVGIISIDIVERLLHFIIPEYMRTFADVCSVDINVLDVLFDMILIRSVFTPFYILHSRINITAFIAALFHF